MAEPTALNLDLVEQKKAAVQERALQKMALLGTKEEQRLVATAEMQGNDLGQAPEVQDIRDLGPVDFASKYGHEAERLRAGYSRTMMELEGLKGRQRTTPQMLGDSAIDAAKMATNTVGGAAVLGLNATDIALGTTMAPQASEVLSGANQLLEGQQSQLMQDRRAQHQLEGELDRQDREVRAAARLEAAAGEESSWDRIVKPTLQNWGEAAGETITNYGDDPIMAGSLVPEAVGSLIPATAGIKIVGKAGAMKALARKGVTGEAAEQALKTAEGRALLQAETLRMAPLVMGVTEIGGAVHQGQLDILSQDEATLSESPQYQTLRAGGATHEDAQLQLAREAGTVAGVVAAPGALIAGRIASGVAAYPLKAGGKVPLLTAVGHAGQEGLEETIQEANSQLASNVGARSIGLERALDEGVAEAGAQGALGGVASVAALQAPAAVLGTTAELAKAAAGATGTAARDWAQGRSERQAAKRDLTSPVGAPARAKASAQMQAAGEQMLSALAPTTPDQSEEPRTEIAARISDGLYANEDDAQGLAGVHPEAAKAAEAGQRMTRSQALEYSADLMDASDEAVGKAMMAISVLQQMEAMRRLDATEVNDFVEALPGEDPLKGAFGQMRNTLATLEASPRVAKAVEVIGEMTSEQLQELLPLDVLSDVDADPVMRNAVADTLQTILAVNPSILGSTEYDRVLNQVGELPPEQRRILTGARDAAKVFEDHAADQAAIEEAVPGAVKQDIVSEEIHTLGNSKNKLPSLKMHRANVVTAAMSGRQADAYDALQDLRDFAQTLANKVGAFNVSATPGEQFGKKVGYEATGPFGMFFRDDAAFINLGSPKSKALAQVVRSDAMAAAQLVKVLADQHNLAVELVEVPELHSTIVSERGNGAKPRPAPAKPKTPAPEKKVAASKAAPQADTAPAPKAAPEVLEKLTKHLEERRNAVRLARLKTEYRKVRIARNKAAKEGPGKTPLISLLKSVYGGIHPESDLGKQLLSRDIRRKDAPGLFSQGGRLDWDNIPVPEEPFLAQRLGQDGQDYLDQNALAEAIEQEINGSPQDVTQEDAEAREILRGYDEGLDALETEIAGLGGEVPVQKRQAKPKAEVVKDGEPTQAQKEAGNYKMRHIKLHGLDISIETDKGAERSGTDANGKTWSVTMPADYGYVKGTEGADGDHVDVYVGEDLASELVFVVDQFDLKSGRFDEHKVVLGTTDEAVAVALYDAGFSDGKGPQRRRAVTAMSIDHFKAWLKEGDQSKPAADTAPTAPTIENEIAAPAISGETPREDEASWLEQMAVKLPRNGFGKQGFLAAFRSAENGSRLLEASDPIAWLQEQVEVGGWAPEQVEALKSFLDEPFTDFAARIETTIQEYVADKGLEDPDKFARALGFPEALPLNLTLEGADGTRYLEPKVMAAAFIATYEWMGQNARKPRQMDREDIAKQFGALQMAAQESIAGTMMTLLDIQPKADGDIRMTQGLLRAIAANALEVLMDEQSKDGKVTEARVLEWRSVPYQVDGEPRQVIMLRPREDISSQPAFQTLTQLRTPFSGLLTDGRVKDRLVGKDAAPTVVSRTRLHNKLSELSEAEREGIARLQGIPSFVNAPMVALVRAIGVDAYKKLLGHVELTDETRTNYSPGHLLTLEGKNQTIEHDLAETLGYVEEAEQLGEKTPIWHLWEISSVGRLQQQGPVTPQGSKIAREMISATNSTLEMGNEKHEWALWAAVAQALGEKIEKLPYDDIPVAAKKLIFKKYAKAVELLEGTPDAEVLAAALPKGVNAKELHALLTVARFNVAKANGDTVFETALALEADGKTDGPVNAMIHMGVGPFSQAELELFAKGGLFFADHPVSLAEYIAQEGRGGEDIYNMASARFEQKLAARLQKVPGQGLAVMGVLNAFLPAFDFTQKTPGQFDMQVGRNVIKNPLTVFLYGSGDDGIAGKVADQVIEQIDVFLSELIQNGKQGLKVSQHPLLAGNPQLLQDMASVLFSGDVEALKSWLVKAPEAKVTPAMQADLRARVLAHFVEPMIEAIDETTGGLQARMKFLQAAAEIQTLLFQDAFKKALDKAAAAKDKTLEPQREAEAKAAVAEGRKARAIGKALLSEQEVKDIFAETMKVAPIYGNDVQSFHISSPERAPMENVTVSASFSGRLKARATYVAPSDASVKVSPFLTIGNGDGRMILNIYRNGDGSFEISLPVFDGVEMGLTTIESASRQINEQVFQAWQAANPYRDVQAGFGQMLAHLSPEKVAALPEAVQKRIAKLGKKQGLGGGTNQILVGFHKQLIGASQQREARTATFAKMAVTSDHMAGAQQPSFQEGVSAPSGLPTDFEAIADTANGIYETELKKLRQPVKARDVEFGYAQPAPVELDDAIQRIGKPVPGHAFVRRLSGEAVAKLLSGPVSRTGASPAQRNLLKDLAALGPLPSDLTFLFGTSKHLEAYRDEWNNNPENARIPVAPIYMGQVSETSNVVFIAHSSPEVIIHELLHKYTDSVLLKHYKNAYNNVASAPHVVHAVSQLEGLMAETETLNTYGMDKVDAASLTHLKNILNSFDTRPSQKAAKLGEFISYMLTNPGLIEKGQKTSNYRALGSVVQNALKWIKKLLGIKGNPGLTLYSNIRFNARLLLAQETAPGVPISQDDGRTEVDRVLNQVYGSDSRLEQVEAAYLNRLADRLSSDMAQIPAGTPQETVERLRRGAVIRIARKKLAGRRAVARAQAAGFDLNPREALAFEAVYAVASSDFAKGEPVQRQMSEALGHVLQTLQVADVYRAMGVTEATADAGQKAQAEGMMAFLTEARRTSVDGLLPSFLALSQTNPLLRDVLSQMAPPKVAVLRWDSVDAWVQSLGRTLVNVLTRLSLKPRLTTAPDLRQELDALAGTLAEVQQNRYGLAELRKASELFGHAVETANAYTSRKLGAASEVASTKLNTLSNRTTLPGAATGFRILGGLASLGSSTAADATGASLTRMLNESAGWHSLRSAFTDIRGMTDDNAPLWRLINPAKAKIDAVRQDSREGVPRHLAAAFSRPLEATEWSRLHHGLARVDLLAIGHEAALDLLRDPASITTRVRDLEEQVDQLGGVLGNRYKAKAKALAIHMATGENTSQNLLTNAHAIAHLFGENVRTKPTPPPDLIKAIDQLTSLYAWQELDQPTRDTVAGLMQTEAQGIQAVTGFLKVARAAEIERRDRHGSVNLTALHNGWKGYVPSTPHEGHAVIVRPIDQHDDLVKRGWTQIGMYAGDSNDSRYTPMAYYQSSVAGNGAFRQGVAQTVNDTWQGVDARTGLSLDGSSAGTLLGARVARVAKRLQLAPAGSLDGLAPGEYLRPIFDEQDEVVAYERSMDPEKSALVPVDDHLGRMLGVWVGRILEEKLADEVNADLVGVLRDIYAKARVAGELGGFVNIADPRNPDPVVRDAWNTLGWRIRRDVEDAFGPGEFWVRRDMVDDAVGFRAATVTDAWTGVSRWSPETQEKMLKVAELIAGDDAFRYLRRADQVLREGVSWAKETIIIRSVKILVENVLSNIGHLMVIGVPIQAIVKGSRDKLSEVTEYVKNREEIQGLQVKMASVIHDPAAMARYETRIGVLEAANKRLSIAPLLEAGEFNTIAEGLDEADVAIRNGKIGEFFGKAVDKLPGWGKTAVKNLAITKDTALYQGLTRGVQYGDFIAKAVLYDHLTQTKGLDRQEALDRILEEFIPYNRLAGRGRDALEAMGLAWFLNYKLRSLPVLVRTMRERPLSALAMFGGGGPIAGVQTLWDGSLLGSAVDGRLGYSVGFGMGLNAPTLHPVGGFVL